MPSKKALNRDKWLSRKEDRCWRYTNEQLDELIVGITEIASKDSFYRTEWFLENLRHERNKRITK